MSLIIKKSPSAMFPQLEPSSYLAVCCGIVDLGEIYSTTYEKMQPKIAVLWELPTEAITQNEEVLPRIMHRVFTASFHEQSALRKMLNNWRGKDLTEDELAGFDMRNIIGAGCFLQIVLNERGYAEIGGVMSLPKGTVKPVGLANPIIFDCDTSPLEEIHSLPRRLQTLLESSETYKARKQCETAGQFSALDDDDGDLPF